MVFSHLAAANFPVFLVNFGILNCSNTYVQSYKFSSIKKERCQPRLPGRWVFEHPGVKAPGTPKMMNFPLLVSSARLTLVPGSFSNRSTEGTESPACMREGRNKLSVVCTLAVVFDEYLDGSHCGGVEEVLGGGEDAGVRPESQEATERRSRGGSGGEGAYHGGATSAGKGKRKLFSHEVVIE